MHRRLHPTLPWLLAVACAACQTGDRLWRITPFEGSPTEDRVNLWPVAYHDGDETSVLWPLFDVDDQGFALRPLVAKDGSAYSVLFPLASFDTEDGTGWVFPFYRFEEIAGLFPVANFGRFSYVGPVWWTEQSSGLFPVAHFGRTSYVGPVWWKADEDGARGGLFPVAMLGPLSYVGPAWWTDGGDFGLFPLFGRGLFGSDVDHVGPVWWRAGVEDGSEFGLWPFLSYEDGGRSFSLLPLYAHELGPVAQRRSYLLGLGRTYRSDDREESWLLPLYWHRDEPGKRDTALLPFFWKRTRGDRADVYTLIGNRAVDPESTTLNLYPLWWSNESGDSAWRMLFPLFYWARDGEDRTLITPLGGRGWSRSGDSVFVNVFGPLYHRSVNRRRDEARTAFLWPLFELHRRGDERTARILGLYSRSSSPTGSETSWALGLGHARRTPTGSSHRLWPLYSWSDDEELPGPVYSLTLFGARSRAGTERLRLFPLFSSERSAAGSEWDALLGFVHHERRGSDTTRSESWRAWPLVSRSVGTGGPSFADRISLVGSSRWEGGRQFQLGASLLYSSSERRSDEEEESRRRALLFFTHEEEALVGPHVPAPGTGRVQNRIRHESRGFLFDACLSESATYHVWSEGVLGADEARALRAYVVGGSDAREGLPDRSAVRSVLESRGVALAGDDPETLRAAIHEFAAANTRTVERRRIRIPLVYGYERTEDELSWSGPLGLVRYEEDPRRSRFSLLYYGYRRETEGGTTRRDVFPFITWDTGPDETSWSFLWRFLRYERKGSRRGGHVLFVPWGDAG